MIMAKNVRIKQTANEKIAAELATSGTPHYMGEQSVDKLIEKEKSYKFNEELNKIAEEYEDHINKLEANAELLGDNVANMEIKPLFSRVIIKPLAQNPFQRVKIENGIIIDAGGITPNKDINPATGRMEEMREFIKTGAVQEIGPDTKYVKPGDIIYYRVDTAVPVPFFKQGFQSLAENQIIAVVNEGLTERFNSVNNVG
jgi:hypothetical protein